MCNLVEACEKITDYSARLKNGGYNREAGILFGFVAALLVAAAGYLLGTIVDYIFSGSSIIPLKAGQIYLVWGVHATVISLSLVGLSFAWNSIRELPTSTDIIEEITVRLQSIETITFLLSANLWIGAGILIVTGDFVSTEIAWAVGTLLIVSFGVTICRFWTVLELLLHNTLDETVEKFAEAVLVNKPDNVEERYNTYLDHFLQASRLAIDNNRPEQLGTKLSRVEDLVDNLLWHNGSGADPEQLLRNTLSNYESLHRQTIRQQNEELQKKMIKSLSSLLWISRNYENLDNTNRIMRSYATIFQRSAEADPSGNAVEFLLSRFENVQTWVLSQFEDANTPARLEVTSELIDNWIETHASLWKTAIEQESTGALSYLHYLVNDLYQFNPYTYAQSLPNPGTDGDSEFIKEKKKAADNYQNELIQLRFAAYAWALHLQTNDDLTNDFLDHIFTEYVESDFSSVNELSNTYFTLAEEEEILNYWERWNMAKELEETHGVASTGMARNTWLLRFYCTAMIWVVKDAEAINKLQEQDPASSPITEYDQVQTRIEDMIDILDSYSDQFSFEELVPGDASIEDRSEALISYFEDVKSLLDEEEQKEIRDLPIFGEAVQRFEDRVNEQLDSCGLRKGIKQAGNITTVDEFSQDKYEELNLYTTSDRRVFVDTGVPTFFSTGFSGIMDKYREFVLDQLHMEEKTIESIDELPDLLAEIEEEYNVGVFILNLIDATDVVRDDDRSERGMKSDLSSFYNFVDIPVIRDGTGLYAAVTLFEDEFEYQELDETDPFEIKVKPGEEVDDWTDEDMPEGKVPADYVQLKFSYKANISSSATNGVVIRLEE